jgi:hypothetical protein
MIKQAREPRTAGRKLTFVLPTNSPPGTVSVVGNFNDWTPGAHVLRRRSNGTRSLSVTLPAGSTCTSGTSGRTGCGSTTPTQTPRHHGHRRRGPATPADLGGR